MKIKKKANKTTQTGI